MSRQYTNPSIQSTTSLVMVACITLSSLSLTAASTKLETNSPFLPPGYSNKKPEAPKPAPKVNGPLSRELEFRGIVQLNGVYEFSLFNKAENQGYWVAENDAEGGIRVQNFDLDARSISVTLNGRTEKLTLMDATDSPLPVVSSPGSKPTNTASTANNKLRVPNTTSKTSNSKNRVIPRRRVILPKTK